MGEIKNVFFTLGSVAGGTLQVRIATGMHGQEGPRRIDMSATGELKNSKVMHVCFGVWACGTLEKVVLHRC